MNFDLKFYTAVFLRRMPIFIVTCAMVIASAFAAAMLLPTVYSASSLLMVESSQIPGALMAPTVQAAALEKLQTMENRLMTRANLLDIANRLKVFKDIDRMNPDEIIQAMRDNSTIKKSANKGEATMMTISFDAETGKIAAGVVNEYVTLILKDDAIIRTKSAEGTADFFDQEVKRLSTKLDEMSAKILDFQNKNSDALPSTLTYRMGQQTTLQAKIDTIDATVLGLKDQRQRLVAIFESTGQVANNAAMMSPEAKQLMTLNDQLRQALAVLSPTHPKVKVLEAQIAQLEIIVKSQAPVDAADTLDANSSMFDVQIADIDSQIAAAAKQREQLDEQMKALQDTIDRTPANQIALDALLRDYSNLQQQYNTAVGRQSSASSAVQVEVLSKGEKISVLDAAAVPLFPAKPNRVLIAVGGILGGIVLGFCAVIVTELLNRSIRRPQDIVTAFGIMPLVSIPYLRTPSETMKRRSIFMGLLLAAVVGIPIVIYAVHVFYQPLDILIKRLAAKFGIEM